MENSKAISKAIAISKIIVRNNIHNYKGLIKKGSPEHDAYVNQVKPLINDYKNEFNGETPNNFLKSILEKVHDQIGFDDKYEIKHFSYWGRRIRSYVWACISLKDNHGVQWPTWLVKDKAYRVGRGSYTLPTLGQVTESDNTDKSE